MVAIVGLSGKGCGVAVACKPAAASVTGVIGETPAVTNDDEGVLVESRKDFGLPFGGVDSACVCVCVKHGAVDTDEHVVHVVPFRRVPWV